MNKTWNRTAPRRSFCLLFFFALLFTPATIWAAEVNISVVHSQKRYPVGGSYPIAFRIHIENPWFIHGPEKQGSDLTHTSFSFQGAQGVKVGDLEFPQPEEKELPYTETPVRLFSGDILVRATLNVSREARVGERDMEGKLRYQACSSRSCLPPKDLSFTWKVLVSPEGSPPEPLNERVHGEVQQKPSLKGGEIGFPFRGGVWLGLLGIFLSGIALNLTPCIYPLIPITVSYFGGRGRGLRGRALIHGVIYLLGLSLTNTTLGVVAALSGGMLGEALQNPFVVILVALILVVMGLSFLGLWEMRVPYFLNRMLSTTFSGYLGTLFMGLALGVIAAPCLGPFILGLLAYVGHQGDPYLGFLVFFVLSMGLGLPIAVLAMFSESINRLPVSGGWMVWIRRFLGWVLIGMAGYMLQSLVTVKGMDFVPVAVVVVLAALDLGWLARTDSKTGPGFTYFRRGAGIFLLACALFLTVLSLETERGVEWVSYDEISLAQAKGEKPVLLEFSADWCLPCRAMDNKVFKDPLVVKLSREFLTIRVDLTQKKPSHEELKERFHIRGVPTVVFLNRRLKEEKDLRIESYVDSDTMAKRMEQLSGPGSGLTNMK